MSRIIDNLKDNLISYIVVAVLSGFITGIISNIQNKPRIEYFCPSFPIGGGKVGEELKKIPQEGFENFWEWIGRIDKLRQELELCR